MDLVQTIVLAIVQGLSEFLPISSSGHLILVPHFLGWPDQGLAFDVAIHMGTLLARALYFRRQLSAMATAWIARSFHRRHNRDSRLAWQVIVATVPVGLAGLAARATTSRQSLRQPLLIAGTLTVFGILMYVADRFGASGRDEYDLTWPQALAIGCAQALALMPGNSRSGVTMTAGRGLGLSRARRRDSRSCSPCRAPRGRRLRRHSSSPVGCAGHLGADPDRGCRVRRAVRCCMHPLPAWLPRADRAASVHDLSV